MKDQENEQRVDKFFEYFEDASKIGGCPFLLDWFERKSLEIANQYQKKPDREGIPKGDPIPPPQGKVMLALLRAILPELSLKKYAQGTAISYDVIRQWARQKMVAKLELDLAGEYGNFYCEKLKDHIENDEFSEALSQIKEVHYYKNVFIFIRIHGFISRLLEDLSEDKIKSDWLYALKIAGIHESFILASTSSDALMEKPELHRKYTESIYSFEKEFIGLRFDLLISTIKNGKVGDAVKVAESVKDHIVNDVMNNYLEHVMALYDKVHGKK
jgi:hypothetical protein